MLSLLRSADILRTEIAPSPGFTGNNEAIGPFSWYKTILTDTSACPERPLFRIVPVRVSAIFGEPGPLDCRGTPHNAQEKKVRSFTLLPRIALTALVLAIWTPVIATIIVVFRIFTSDGGPAYRLARHWTRTVSRSMGLTFSLQGEKHVAPGTSYIVTPNHQGNADILALYGVLPLRFRWVVKKSLIGIPFFGWALHCTGAISIDRSDRESSIKKLQEGTSKLSGGWSLLIYPEGTRGKDPHLQPFKKGAFMMAVQTGIPILPVVCNGAFRILPKKTIAFRKGGHITVTIGNPITTQGLTVQDVPALMEKTRAEMLKLLDPDYDPYGGRPSALPEVDRP